MERHYTEEQRRRILILNKLMTPVWAVHPTPDFCRFIPIEKVLFAIYPLTKIYTDYIVVEIMKFAGGANKNQLIRFFNLIRKIRERDN
jgi:hypothetical protein